MNYINQQGSWISMLTKLISKITIMLGENNLLNYSESCTSEVQDDAIIEGYQYCMSMNRAFAWSTAFRDLYSHSFWNQDLFTDIVITTKEKFKIFHPHARYAYGNQKSYSGYLCVIKSTYTNHKNISTSFPRNAGKWWSLWTQKFDINELERVR